MAAPDPALLAQAPARTRWGLVLLTLAAGYCASFQIGKMPGTLPVLRDDLALGLVAAGWSISLLSVLGMVAGSGVGAVADRIGHRNAILIGLGCIVGGNLLGATAAGSATILVARAIEGAGYVAVIVAGPTLVLRLASAKGFSLALGIWTTFLPGGMALMIALTPFLLAAIGWRGMWLANAAVAALVAVALWAATRGPGAPRPRSSAGPRPRLIGAMVATAGRAGPMALALVFATYSLNFIALHGFLPTFLIEDRGMAPARATLMVAAAVVANVPGIVIGGWLIHRGTPRWALMMAGHVLMAGCAIGIFLLPIGNDARLALVFVFSCAGGVVPIAVLRSAPLHAPSQDLVATTNGLINQGVATGQVIGPPLLAALVAGFGSWRAAPLLIVGSAALGLAVAIVVHRLERQRPLAA